MKIYTGAVNIHFKAISVLTDSVLVTSITEDNRMFLLRLSLANGAKTLEY